MTEAENGSPAAAKARKDLLGEMDVFVHEAKRRENELLTKKKFVAADQTAKISERGIAVGESKPTGKIEEDIQSLAAQIVELDAKLATAKDYRVALETVVRQIQSNELGLQKQIAGIEADQKRLRDNLPNALQSTGEWINRGPVLDALYTGNIKLEQIWLPDMKINYNFSSVARYDRCIVCHRQIDKTAAGSATEAGLSGDSAGEARSNRATGHAGCGSRRRLRATIRTTRSRRSTASFWPSVGRLIRMR